MLDFCVIALLTKTLKRKVIISYSYHPGLIKIVIASFYNGSGLMGFVIAPYNYRFQLIGMVIAHSWGRGTEWKG